jgi:RNA polymerase subunit RPABC4/transcription elongation factor Spt4
MKVCKKCGQILSDKDIFCWKCGNGKVEKEELLPIEKLLNIEIPNYYYS